MSQFDELLKSLQDVADEQDENGTGTAAGDETDDVVAAAAADSGVAAPGAGAGDDDDEADAGGAPMAKSFVLQDSEGNEQEAIDATELLKSLMDRQGSVEQTLAKALGSVTGLVKKQGDMIKSLNAKIDDLSSQGRGRKTVLSVVDKPDAATMAKSHAAGAAPMSPGEIMAKCLAGQKSGALTGMDVARAEISINNGVPLPADIVSRLK